MARFPISGNRAGGFGLVVKRSDNYLQKDIRCIEQRGEYQSHDDQCENDSHLFLVVPVVIGNHCVPPRNPRYRLDLLRKNRHAVFL